MDAPLHIARHVSLEITPVTERSVPVESSKTEGARCKEVDSKFQTGANGSGDRVSTAALYITLTVLQKVPKDTVHCCITLKAEKERGCDIYSVHLCIGLHPAYNWDLQLWHFDLTPPILE